MQLLHEKMILPSAVMTAELNVWLLAASNLKLLFVQLQKIIMHADIF